MAKLPVPLRLGTFLLILGLLWLPFALPLHFLLRHDPNFATIVIMAILFLEFFAWVWVWGQRVQGYAHPFMHYGLIWTRPNGIHALSGLAIGVGFTIALFLIMAACGWVEFQPAVNITLILLEGLLVGLGVGLAEEFVFRGWLLDELELDYGARLSLWINALLFAVAHYIKPLGEILRTLPQFFGLTLLGLILVWAKRRTRYRLGLAIGLHSGLIWGYYIINVGDLVRYTAAVPEWVTGIDRNPLAGGLGIG
ncbi:MAG: CPBP family intramembrane metalloprotease, partial [Spirulina sp. DLM2.Bin59]